MFIKHDFMQNDDVLIHSFGDGREYRARVVGKAVEGVLDVYIVELIDIPMGGPYQWTHSAITEACLKRALKPHSMEAFAT